MGTGVSRAAPLVLLVIQTKSPVATPAAVPTTPIIVHGIHLEASREAPCVECAACPGRLRLVEESCKARVAVTIMSRVTLTLIGAPQPEGEQADG